MKNEYALRMPKKASMPDAGTRAIGTSPIAATPAGSARTPLPMQALMRLNVAWDRLCVAAEASSPNDSFDDAAGRDASLSEDESMGRDLTVMLAFRAVKMDSCQTDCEGREGRLRQYALRLHDNGRDSP
mmetsp:Transcript_46653/g.141352  ORF Transcript_46653/g.141352 Transcript_46653/m.141352 type:complete len:129 (+) Transcript_46653:1249-1635(+)